MHVESESYHPRRESRRLRWRCPACDVTVLIETFIVAYALGAGASSMAAQGMPVLTLREVSAIPIPASLDITSGKILNDSTVAFLSRLQRTVWVLSRSSAHAVCARDLTSPVALGVRDGLVAVLDADHRLVSQLPDSKVRCRSQPVALDTSDTVTDAVAVRTGWVLAVRSRDARSWIVRLDADGRELRRSSVTGASGDAFSTSQSLLSTAGDSAIFASTVWPFRWAVVGRAGPAAIQHSPLRSAGSPTARTFPATKEWVGLRTVPLDSGFLQVLAERSGERRAMVLYDRQGRLHRVSEMTAILGVLETVPSSRRLLMLRRTGEPELVLYEWGWGGTKQYSPR